MKISADIMHMNPTFTTATILIRRTKSANASPRPIIAVIRGRTFLPLSKVIPFFKLKTSLFKSFYIRNIIQYKEKFSNRKTALK
jgi:hypothetical protein